LLISDIQTILWQFSHYSFLERPLHPIIYFVETSGVSNKIPELYGAVPLNGLNQ